MEYSDWLDDDALRRMAVDLLFEKRLRKRLDYIKIKYSEANGLEMFDIMAKYLSTIMLNIRLHLSKTEYLEEDDIDKNLMRVLDIQEKLDNCDVPIREYIPAYAGSNILITYRHICFVRDSIVKLIEKSDKRNESQSLNAEQLQSPLFLDSNKNNFNTVPLEVVRKHFMLLNTEKNRNNEPFLNIDQIDKFIVDAFVEIKTLNEEDKITINYSSTERLFVVRLFYDFFKLYEHKYPLRNEKSGRKYYIQLLCNYFKGFDFEKISQNFNKEPKKKWKYS